MEKWVPNPERLAKIKELASTGVREESIARAIGLHPSTLSLKKTEFPEIAEIIENARAQTEGLVTSALFRMINDPGHKQHAAAVFFYLKTRCGWRETNITLVPESKTKPSSVKVIDLDEDAA